MVTRTRYDEGVQATGAGIIAFLALLVRSSAASGDWPAWRGPQRDALAASLPAPAVAQPPRKVWEVKTGGGYSSPILTGQRVVTHWREADAEVVAAFDFGTGRELWRHRYTSPFAKSSYAPNMEPGPYSTPAASPDGKLVVTLGGSGVLSCLDAATGRLIWRNDKVKVSTAKLYTGTAMSPLIDGASAIAFLGDDTRAALTAFDLATGAERWSLPTADPPGYASPILATLDGKRQVVTLTGGRVIGVNPANGELLWSLAFPDQWNENIVTPVRHGAGRLILSGVRRGTIAVQSGRVEWSRPDLPMYMSSPIVEGDTVYGFSSRNKGQFFALDARTGKTLWSSEGRQGETAGLLALGPASLAALMPEGELVIAERTPAAWKQTAKLRVAEAATWTQPVPTGAGLLIKSVATLARWDWAAPR